MTERTWADGEELSVFAIGTLLLRNRWSILRWGLAGALITLAFVWTRPALYQASASFIPQGADPNRSGLASLAGQLGVSVGSGSPTLTPDFYLRLLKSREVLTLVAHDTLVVPELGGRRMSVEDLLHLDPAPPKIRDEAAVEKLEKVVNAAASKTTAVVEFTVDTEWPSVSLAITQQLLAGVNDFNQRMRHDQASAERKFIESRLSVASDDLRLAEDRLQGFLQGNRVLGAPELQFSRDRLQRDVTLRQQVFGSLTQAYDDVRMRELRDTPVITMVDPPSVLPKPEPRRRGVRALLGFLVGSVIGAILAFIRDAMAKRRTEGDAAANEFASTVDEMTGGVVRRLRRLGGRASA